MQLNKKEKLIQDVILKVISILNEDLITLNDNQSLFNTVNISVHKNNIIDYDEELVDDIASSIINKIGFNVIWKSGSEYNFEIIDISDFDSEIIVLVSYGYGVEL